LALAVLEARANGADFGVLRTSYHYVFTEADWTSGDLETVPDTHFEGRWAHSPDRTRQLGSRWFTQRRALYLGVRSAVLAAERNFIINTVHPGFHRLHFSDPADIPLDPRI
jgi:RES domain-containing protein